MQPATLRVLALIPPMTQLNTPYPSTAYLTGFLRGREERRNFMIVEAGNDGRGKHAHRHARLRELANCPQAGGRLTAAGSGTHVASVTYSPVAASRFTLNLLLPPQKGSTQPLKAGAPSGAPSASSARGIAGLVHGSGVTGRDAAPGRAA